MGAGGVRVWWRSVEREGWRVGERYGSVWRGGGRNEMSED